MTEGEAEVRPLLERAGLVGPSESLTVTALPGGVSSDIWRVETSERRLCVKRALAQLRVAQTWEAPLDRNHYEAEWLRVARSIVPDAVPKLLAEIPDAGVIVMDFLDPVDFPLWKDRLRAGDVSADFAFRVGETLAILHAATAGRDDIARRFATERNFRALRLEPYFEATGRVHRDLQERLMQLSATTAATRRCLVHGDVSPKNILVGAATPVFLDAECAWFGDPAFDFAFVLNHLLLKCLWTPHAAAAFIGAFRVLAGAYLDSAAWEERRDLEARAAALLPGLLLARVDGKSPVEYVQSESDKDRVRRTARRLLLQPVRRLGDVADSWSEEIGR